MSMNTATSDRRIASSFRPWLSAALLVGLVCSVVPAAAQTVYNIHLHTDSTPDWVDRESFLASTMPVWNDPQNQGIALWRWLARNHRQTHATREDGRYLWDPFHFYSSYTNTYCGFMAAFMTTMVDGMGGDWRHRYVELGDHTVMEMSWDAGDTWHMFDTSMVVYALNHDGVVASADELGSSAQCQVSRDLGDPGDTPGHYYLYHTAQPCMTNPPDPAHAGELTHPSGYRTACDNPIVYTRTLRNGADSYISGTYPEEERTHVRYGWSYRLHLRPDQTYTRYWTRLGDTSDYYRSTSGGEDPDATSIAAGFHGNGLWTFTPDLDTPAYRAAIFDESGIAHRDETGGGGPRLQVGGGAGGATVCWKVDAANVATSATVHLTGNCPAGDAVLLYVSRDAGITWTPLWSAPDGGFDLDFDLGSALVGGAHEFLVRIEFADDGDDQRCGLNGVTIETITQLNAFTLPRFTTGRNVARFALGEQQESLTLWPPLHGGQYDDSAADWDNIHALASSDATYKAVIMPAAAGEGRVTWRIQAPTDIVGVRYGGSFLARTGGAQEWVKLQHSYQDGGFITDTVYDASSASTWDDRIFADLVPGAGVRDIRMRYVMSSAVGSDYVSTGVNDALMTVHHAPRAPGFAPVVVTWCWTEHRNDGDVTREHTRIVTSADDAWAINVGGYREPTMEWVRLRLADGGETTGYSDGVDVGTGAGRDLVRTTFAWNADVARGRPYTVSRPASLVNGDGGGGELTDGVIAPPTTWVGATVMQGQTALWEGDDPLSVALDLGAVRTVAAVRVTTHQPLADYAHAGTITVSGSTDNAAFTGLGVIQHDDVWSPMGDHQNWGFEQSPEFAGLPAGGRLTYGFWLILDAPVDVRWLKLDFLPLAGYGLSISEIQAFSQVTVEDWPDRDVVVPDVSAAAEPRPQEIPAPRLSLSVWPNPSNPQCTVTYSLPRPGFAMVNMVDLRGRIIRTLAAGWLASGAHQAIWDGRDDNGRAVSSGAYLSRVIFEDSAMTARVTLVR